jgi:hypothetical protein
MSYIKLITQKIKKDFNILEIAKYAFFFSISYLVFEYFKIESFIESKLFFNKEFKNSYLFLTLFIIASLIIIVYWYRKAILLKYVPSLKENLFMGILFILVLKFRFNQKLDFVKITFYYKDIYYADIIIIVLASYFILNVCRYLIIKPPKQLNNKLLSDAPLNENNESQLNFDSLGNKIEELLIDENHEKAISIGIIGPWGNGKTSLIKFVENKIKENKESKDKYKDLITITFLPYLNHNENDVINEFFTILSNEISKYSGKLSNDLMTYAHKLNELNDENKFLTFVNKYFSNQKNESANELYESINNELQSINKKIIVFIDDLDRLNTNEILQVLKLIRNSANFFNIIFVVAMDKEYVVNRLKKSEDILNSKYIDKFFQLEIYLPEIDVNLLKQSFIKGLKDKFKNNDFDFDINSIDEHINSSDNLFEDYILNFRDLKRAVNQICFDYPITKGQINFKDFVNFTYFKLKFPLALKILKFNKNELFEIDFFNKVYVLIKTEDGKKDTLQINDKFYISHLVKYELFNLIKDSQNINFDFIDKEDNLLFIKTMAFLFGEENSINDVNSIKNHNNFAMIMEQKVHENLLLNKEFDDLFKSTKDKLLFDEIDKLISNNKKDQILNRLVYYISEDNNELEKVLTILLYLFSQEDNSFTSNLDAFKMNIFFEFINKRFKMLNGNVKEKDDFYSWVQNNIYEKEFLSNKLKIIFISQILTNQKTIVKKDDLILIENLEKAFDNFLEEHDKKLWEINDYSFFSVYHAINFSNKKSNYIEKIKDYWLTNNIEFLCVNVTIPDSFSNKIFKISEIVTDFFGSKIDFINFVKEHKDSDKPEIKEFLQLYELIEIDRFYHPILFEFNHSQLMKQKINYTNFSEDEDEYSNVLQLVLESENEKIFVDINNSDLWKQYFEQSRRRPIFGELNNKHYYFVYLENNNTVNESIINFIDDLNKIYLSKKPESKSFIYKKENILKQEKFWYKKDDESLYLKIKSIQPNNLKIN